MEYAKPVIKDLGSIADHTFITPSGSRKGPREIVRDASETSELSTPS